MQGGAVIGVIGGTAASPGVSYLGVPLPVSPAVVALADGVAPEEVFRFAAPVRKAHAANSEAGNARLRSASSPGFPESRTAYRPAPSGRAVQVVDGARA
jgi:hypothetical protein